MEAFRACHGWQKRLRAWEGLRNRGVGYIPLLQLFESNLIFYDNAEHLEKDHPKSIEEVVWTKHLLVFLFQQNSYF